MNELNDAQRAATTHTDGPLLIVAGAGAGKTRVIVERIAHLIKTGVPPERILAVTFTNKAAKELKERIGKIIGSEWTLSPYDAPKFSPFAATFHGLSLHILAAFHTRAGLPKRFTIFDRSDSLRAAKKAIEEAGFDPKELEPSRVLSIMSRHKGLARDAEAFRAYGASSYVDEAVAEVWEKYDALLRKEKALDFDDILLFAHRLLHRERDVREHFQNAWSHIHVDEYQDINQVQYEIVRALSETHKNVCVVGDTDQCLIGGTAVAMADGRTLPIEKVRKGDMVLSNYGSGVLRGARVVKTRTRIHKKHLVQITMKSGRVITSTPEHIHFADYRLGVSPQYYFTYLMHKKNVGWRLGVSQVHTKGQQEPKVGFKQRCLQEHADSVWVVGVFKTGQEARMHEYLLSLRYGIPTLPFIARKGGSQNGYVHDQQALDIIFKSINTEEAALALLKDRGLSLSHPHHRAQSYTGIRRAVVLTLCSDCRSSRPMHSIAMVGRDVEGKRALFSLGLSVRPAKRGSRSWRFETVRADYGEVLALAKEIRRVLPDTAVLCRARLGGEKKRPRDGNSLHFLPAASVLPGMALFSEGGGYEIVESVERADPKTVRVYDLDVENTHNFIANGVVTHNCIYSWRGASLEHLLNFEQDFPNATTVTLSKNYRSTKNILQAANDAIQKNVRRKEKTLETDNHEGEAIRVAGLMSETEEARFVARECRDLIRSGWRAEDIAVLYRANFQSRALEEAFLSLSSVPYQVLGTRFFDRKEIKDALSYLRLAQNPDASSDFARIVNTPARGIGKVTLAKVLVGEEASLSPAQQGKVNDFHRIIERIRETVQTHTASEAVKTVLKESGLQAHFESGKGEDAERLENLKELVSVASKYDALPPGEGIARLIEEAALQSEQDELAVRKEDRPGVKLMTVHASKGLEFPIVFVTGLEDGLFPHEKTDDSSDPEEERRLFYVALTRAGTLAYLTYALSRRIFGARVTTMPSEFIAEMDPSLVRVVAAPVWGGGESHRAGDEDVIIE